MNLAALSRRALLLSATTALLSACALLPTRTPMPDRSTPLPPPIVFVHGNGDSAALCRLALETVDLICTGTTTCTAQWRVDDN